jgi:bifunctional enzyme CysN/CysC
MENHREHMNVVVVGHVDHGKSTVIGRLLADTGSLPKGKLERVKETCRRNARPFEYAFLLDALKDEQAQGITIDAARCFFKTAKRDYIIIDAPGHVEFLKNMVSGATRAEAALLVIDAKEGIMENSKRQMDLVGYDQAVFEKIKKEYSAFLSGLSVRPDDFIPVSAIGGDNIAAISSAMPWYRGASVLGRIDAFINKSDESQKPFRMPVQDIYKFTEGGDDRRIFAGTVEAGSVSVGDEVVFYPSGKKTTVQTIEGFNKPPQSTVSHGRATGFTLADELYIRRGEIMCKACEPPPFVQTRFTANVFWMGVRPLGTDKKYILKIGAARAARPGAFVHRCRRAFRGERQASGGPS